jgi:hypothetical protein
VEDDDDEDDEFMVAEPPSRNLGKKWESTSREEEYEFLKAEQKKTGQANPYVLDIIGVRGIQEEIAEKELDCLLFLSATWCKTCKR